MKMLKLFSALAITAAVAVPAVTLAGAPAAKSGKPTIVLVHGAWETAAIWGQVEAGLEKDGFTVREVVLPGRTGNPAAPDKVTLAMYQQAIAAVVGREKGKVVLVGHSFAGFPISAEAEAEPTKIRTLVYVAAYLPKSGQSLLGLATTDAGSKVGPVLTIDKERGLATIAYDGRGALFANDAPKAVGDMVAKGIVDEPLGPLVEPVTLTAARFGTVDKVYVHTARDLVVSPGLQKLMVSGTPVRLELSINSGHTPFITHPGELVSAIEQAAQ